MVSTYTTRKRLEKQTPGENNNSWGSNLNSGTFDMIDECFGVVCVAMTTAGDSTLSQANGATDEGRRSQIILTGAPTSNVRLFVPAVQSFYLVRNKMTGSNRVRLTNSGGTNGVDFSGSGSGAEQGLVISDGTNVREVFRTVSIGGFSGFVSSAIAAVSDAPTDATGGNLNDRIPFYDASETGAPLNKVPVSAFLNNAYADLTEETAVSVSDGFVLYADSDSTLKRANLQSVLRVINTLTEETTAPVSSTFLLSYETSVGVPRKISVQNATKFVNSGAKNGNYTVTTGDRNGAITYSGMSSDFTLTLPTAASFGIGNIFWFSHEDTGINPAYAVTFDPNGSETIDGATTRKAYSGTRIGVMAISGGWKTICGNWYAISPQQTVNAGDDATISHGQPNTAKVITWFLVNLTTELGYVAGDRVNYQAYVDTGGGTGSTGIAVWSDSTNFGYSIGSSFTPRVPHKTTGALTAITAGNWAVVIVGIF